MIHTRIVRDHNGLGKSQFCEEMPQGGIRIHLPELQVDCELGPEDIEDTASFAETFQHLNEKSWFTPAVASYFTLLVSSCWMAKSMGWRVSS